MQLSGIGDRQEVTKHGIQLVKHLAGVGKNLRTHILVPVATLNKSGRSYFEEARQSGVTGDNVRSVAQRNWFMGQQGPLRTLGLHAGAHLKTSATVRWPFFILKISKSQVEIIDHGWSRTHCLLVNFYR